MSDLKNAALKAAEEIFKRRSIHSSPYEVVKENAAVITRHIQPLIDEKEGEIKELTKANGSFANDWTEIKDQLTAQQKALELAREYVVWGIERAQARNENPIEEKRILAAIEKVLPKE